jgi:endoglycosylceramidase
MTWLKDLDLYERMLHGAAPILQEFERSRVHPFYQRVAAAIRRDDRDHLLFLETSMGSNMGIPTALEPLKDSQGRRDPAQAFAPHAYDIVVDTAHLDLMSQDRLALILKRHQETAERLEMPMLVGEWGAYYLNPDAAESARFTVRLLDQLGCSDTYWSYSPELASSPLLAVLRQARTLPLN